ncbi:hypothetical protein G1O98_35280 [Nostoc sp. UIC10630]|nr:hypothetical protein [Nostoc sp. UIC 10630]
MAELTEKQTDQHLCGWKSRKIVVKRHLWQAAVREQPAPLRPDWRSVR